MYINGIEAAVTWFEPGPVCETLSITTPMSEVEGAVDIVLVNYDAGTAVYKGFSYVRSTPVIKTVIPAYINMNGNVSAYFTGTNFTKWSNISSLVTIPGTGGNPDTKEKVIVGGMPVDANTVIDTLMYFGDESTNDMKTINTATGPFFSVMDNLRFEAVRDPAGTFITVKISKASDGSNTPFRQFNFSDKGKHLFIITASQQGKVGIAEEGVLLEYDNNILKIQRRIATQAQLGDVDISAGNSYGSVITNSPPISIIGKRFVYIKNSDGAIAKISLEITNPLSKPTITSMTPKSSYLDGVGAIQLMPVGGAEPVGATEYYTYIPMAGGSLITINGKDFRDNVKVFLNEVPLTITERSNTLDKMVVKLPAGTTADAGVKKRIFVINEDGGTYDSGKIVKPHYLIYKDSTSKPIVRKVSPIHTSQKGGNSVTLTGLGFMNGMRVFIGNFECQEVLLTVRQDGSFDDTQAVVKIPIGIAEGKALLQVINPDNGYFEIQNAISIISNPTITKITNDKGRVLDPIVFSIEGGQVLTLIGTNFLTAPQIIIGGKLVPISDVQESDKYIKCYNAQDAEMAVIGGIPASSVSITNSSSLKFTTPAEKTGPSSIVLINSDGGVSNIFTAEYLKPMPDTPTGLTAVAVDSDTIKLEWAFVEGARYYEVYVSKSQSNTPNNNFEYRGSVSPIDVGNGVLRYFIEGLTPSTWYSVKLKAVNNFGASLFSSVTPMVRTMSAPISDIFQNTTEYQGDISVEDKLSYQGRTSILSAGERSIASKLLTVAFNKPQFILSDPKVLDINLVLIKKYQDTRIVIEDYSINLDLLTKNLLTSAANSISSSDAKDSKVRLTIDKRQGASSDQIKIRVPSGYGIVQNPTGILLDLYRGKKVTAQKLFNGDITALFKYPSAKKTAYPGGLYIGYYNTATRKVEILGTEAGILSGQSTASTAFNRTGSYLIIGKKKK